MNADGSGQTNLSNNPAFDRDPNWSPDSNKIVFYSNRDGNMEIYVMNADGSSPTRLTNNSSDDRNPSWSPDGTKIIFNSERDGNREIYVMNADGTGQTRLTTNTSIDEFPDWQPIVEQAVGGTLIPIDATSLLLANTQSFSWMIPVVLSVLGIGLFVFRRSENS